MDKLVRFLYAFTVRILLLQFAVNILPGMDSGCLALLETGTHSQMTVPQMRPADFGKSYQGTVNSSSQVIFEYTYQEFRNMTIAVRLTVKILSNVDVNYPVQFVARQKQGIMSWQIPFVLEYNYAYSAVSRTLCPLDAANITKTTTQQTIYLDVSTMEETNVSFIAEAIQVPSFLLRTNKELTLNITPSEPKYYMYTFADNVDSVVVTAASNDDLCMVLSVQDFRCPVYGLDRNVNFLGAHQTMTKQAAITAKKSDYDKHSFFVVMVLKPNDLKCLDVADVDPSSDTRTKTLSIKIVPVASATKYHAAIAIPIIALLVFSAVAYVVYWAYCEKILRPLLFTMKDYHEERLTSGDINAAIKMDALYVTDLAKTSANYREMKFTIYCSTLVVISVFYGLPVLQQVLTYQKMLYGSGNEDFCYYNFECARPLGIFNSFNNLYSNIGYVILGMLFIILVWKRTKFYKDAMKKLNGPEKSSPQQIISEDDEANNPDVGERRLDLTNTYGIPYQSDLFYSMGFALIMEGVMSACYHMCPNRSNFQYDTSFMYIITCLYLLRIYQNRHSDITPKSHKTFVVIAIVIFIAFLGLVVQSTAVWVIFWLLDTVGVLLLSIWLYYMGQIDINMGTFGKIFNFVIRNRGLCSKPTHKSRFGLIAAIVFLNWLYVIYGLVYQPPNFATFLLRMFIGNLMLYTAYYITMKMIQRENCHILTLVCIFASLILWSFALYFYRAHLTSWRMTPARSRELNEPCQMMDFFDKHDVWHFLSATSIFFSFMIFLTVDDQLLAKKRNEIIVF